MTTIAWHVGDIGIGTPCDNLVAYRAAIQALGAITHFEMQEPAASPDPDDTVAINIGLIPDNGNYANMVAYQVDGPVPEAECLTSQRFSTTVNSRMEVFTERSEYCLPGDFSVLAWVNPASLGDGDFDLIFGNRVNASPEFKWCISVDGSSRLNVRTFRDNLNSHLTCSYAGTVFGTWYFVGGRLDDSAEILDLFIDGVLEVTDNTPTGSRVACTTQGLTVGSSVNNFAPNADILLCTAFNYMLTDQDFADLYSILTTT